MFEDNYTEMDLTRMMKRYAKMNPDVSLSDIAFLMDVPAASEAWEEDLLDTIEGRSGNRAERRNQR